MCRTQVSWDKILHEFLPFCRLLKLQYVQNLGVLVFWFIPHRLQLVALVHTLTPSCSVFCQFFSFFPGNVHVLEISFDVHLKKLYPVHLPLLLIFTTFLT